MNTTNRILLAALGLALSCTAARAHCDTQDGPVASVGQQALATGDLKPVLRWVHHAEEAELKAAFEQARAARAAGPAAQKVADRWFLETLVRLHRAGEGAPFTGLKPAGTGVPEPIAAADAAIGRGNVDAVVNGLQSAIAGRLRPKFAALLAARKHADESVEKGRAYVALYVDFIHEVERLHGAIEGAADQHGHTDM